MTLTSLSDILLRKGPSPLLVSYGGSGRFLLRKNRRQLNEISFEAGFEYQTKEDARFQEEDARPLGAGGFKKKAPEGQAQADRMTSDEPFDKPKDSSRATSRDENLPKEERLAKTKDFRYVYEKGASFKVRELILYRLAIGLGKNRIGLSIGRAKVALAARRNRIKRLVREIYRKNKIKFLKGFDIVVVVKRDPGTVISYKNIEKTFIELAKRSGLLE